jgi:hypothetical protein
MYLLPLCCIPATLRNISLGANIIVGWRCTTYLYSMMSDVHAQQSKTPETDCTLIDWGSRWAWTGTIRMANSTDLISVQKALVSKQFHRSTLWQHGFPAHLIQFRMLDIGDHGAVQVIESFACHDDALEGVPRLEGSDGNGTIAFWG